MSIKGGVQGYILQGRLLQGFLCNRGRLLQGCLLKGVSIIVDLFYRGCLLGAVCYVGCLLQRDYFEGVSSIGLFMIGFSIIGVSVILVFIVCVLILGVLLQEVVIKMGYLFQVVYVIGDVHFTGCLSQELSFIGGVYLGNSIIVNVYDRGLYYRTV